MKKTQLFVNRESVIAGFLPAVMLMLLLSFTGGMLAQTTVYTDDFNRGTFGTSGGTPNMTWTTYTTVNGTYIGYSRTEQNSGSNYRLAIMNGSVGSGSTQTYAASETGRTYVYGLLNTFLSPYATTLSTNKNDIVWTMNIRTGRTSGDNGFNALTNYYGYAVVLCATGSDFLSASGYAVTLRKGTTLNAVRLERFNGGLTTNSNLTTIIGPSEDITSNNYFSVKVVYSPLSNKWKLYTRIDVSSPADPTIGTLTLVGNETVDNTYTSADMTHCGFFMNHQSTSWNSGNNKGNFDNFKVVVDNRLFTPTTSTDWSSATWGQGALVPGSNYDVQIPSDKRIRNTGSAACKVLNLHSASAEQSSQLFNTGSLTIADKIRVKVSLSNVNTWRFLGFPFAVTAVYKADGVTPAVINTDYRIATYNAATRASGQSGWEAVTVVNNDNPMAAGKGYIVAAGSDLYFETASAPSTDAFAASNDASLGYVTGSAGASHDGWNFIVSPVVANATMNLAEGQFRYVYNGTTYGVDDSEDGDLTEYPFRAFFIKTTSAVSKTFSVDNPSPVRAYKTESAVGKATFYLETAGVIADTKLRINALSTTGYDVLYDAEKMFPFSSSVPQIYTRSDDKNLAINAFPEGNSVPLVLRIAQAGNCTISWVKQTESGLYLEDRLTGELVNTDLTDSYSFSQTQTGTISDRFRIISAPAITTAVKTYSDKNISIAVSHLQVVVAGLSENQQVELYDLSGRKLQSRAASGNCIITLPATGMYLLKVRSEQGIQDFKILSGF